MEIDVRVDDLAFMEADAIVWPVSAELRPTTPAMRRLEQAGGAALARQLKVQEPLAVGSAVVTGAGELPAELLISAVVLSAEEAVSAKGVRRAMASALHRAEAFQAARVGCAPLGVGVGGLSVETSAEIMVDVLTQHAARASHPARVTIVVETEEEQQVFTSALTRAAR